MNMKQNEKTIEEGGNMGGTVVIRLSEWRNTEKDLRNFEIGI